MSGHVVADTAELDAGLADGRYVTTRTGCKRLGVTPERIRDWKRRPAVDLDVLRWPDGSAVRRPGIRGLQNVWLWTALAAVDALMSASRRGRPRRRGETTGCSGPRSEC